MVREIAGVLILGVSATVAMAQSPPAVSADTSMWDPSVSRAADQNLSRKLSQTGGVITACAERGFGNRQGTAGSRSRSNDRCASAGYAGEQKPRPAEIVRADA